MSKLQLLIGTDTTTEEMLGDDGAPDNADVYVEANNGTVCITGPFEGWMGYAELADLGSAEAGEALARRIAANPVAELSALGYDHANWFKAA
ncbi:MAG: hypothetical protein RL375_1739 [Pseudomonadota bacterium]|jgi:hypothetical protein